MSIDDIKCKIGTLAGDLVQNGMTVGLGTGTTAFYFIKRLMERCQEGLEIQAVASSTASLKQAHDGGIPMIDIENVASIDLTVDSADEIDRQKQMIKGGGGALLREKIVATMSKEMIVIVDETKLSEKLGRSKLPVEIVPFAHHYTKSSLEKLGYSGEFRRTAQGLLFMTDNGNLILDLKLDPASTNPREDHVRIREIPGVVETGFFFDLAQRVIIGYKDGKVQIRD
jgi:ribose 5-phosphate isomerase A